MAAWGQGSLSGAEIIKGGSFTTGPASVYTPLGHGENICTIEAVSCSINYNGCCVPTLGKFTLAQQWIPNRVESKFTIHGLWPGDCRTGRGTDDICDATRDYFNNELERYIQGKPLLYAKMQSDMPSSNNDHISHWKHQWRKHGTCVSDIKPGCHNLRKGQDVVRYFKMTTELYDTYDVTSASTRGAVVPRNDPYTSQNFYTALRTWANHLTLHCINNKIVEIRIYLLGKYGNNFIADPNHHGSGNCSNSIIFPLKAGNHNRVITQTGPSMITNQPQSPVVGSRSQSQAIIRNQAQIGNRNRVQNVNQQLSYISNGQSRAPAVNNPFQSQTPNNPIRAPINSQSQQNALDNQYRNQVNNNQLQGQGNRNQFQGQGNRNHFQGQANINTLQGQGNGNQLQGQVNRNTLQGQGNGNQFQGQGQGNRNQLQVQGNGFQSRGQGNGNSFRNGNRPKSFFI